MKNQEIKWHKTESGDWESKCKRFRIEPMHFGSVSPSSYILHIDGKRWHSYGRLRLAKSEANAKISESAESLEQTRLFSEFLKKQNAKRQAAFRARKATSNLSEVRGIFATEENALKIRQFAESLKT